MEQEREELIQSYQEEKEELIEKFTKEREELEEELAATQKDRDDSLMFAENEKQQVRRSMSCDISHHATASVICVHSLKLLMFAHLKKFSIE